MEDLEQQEQIKLIGCNNQLNSDSHQYTSINTGILNYILRDIHMYLQNFRHPQNTKHYIPHVFELPLENSFPQKYSTQ